MNNVGGFRCGYLALFSVALQAGLLQAEAAPIISRVEPEAAVAGAEVTIYGQNFGPVAAANIVRLGAVRGVVTAATSSNLNVRVPTGATFSPITVTIDGLTARAARPFLPTFPGNGSPVAAATLEPGFTMPTPPGPTPIAIADLDDDGKPDLVIGNGLARSIWILRNVSTNGTLAAASFEPPIELSFAPGDPYKVAAADIDGDGKLDLIVATFGTSQFSIFRNTTEAAPGSAISFGPRLDIQAGADCRSARAADLDGDGRLDIITANYAAGTISILKNIGSPGNLGPESFASRVDLPAPAGPYDIATGDLDGDGKPDIALATYGQATSVYRNLSSSGMLDSNCFDRVDFPAPPSLDTIEIGDLDGDGRLDIVAGSMRPDEVVVYRNTGSAPFSTNSLARPLEFPTQGWTHNVALADFDGDSKADIAAVGELVSYLSIFQNVSSPGALTPASLGPRVDYSAGWNAWGLAVGDLDGDGRPDITFANHWDSTFTVYHNSSPVAGAPFIISPPVDQLVAVGDSAAFQVTAYGTPELQYQWRHGDTALAGATQSTLAFSATQDSDAGSYFVVVSNSFGSVTSSVVTLTFTNFVPYITAEPRDLGVPLHGAASLSVIARGTRPLNYQWHFNGTNLQGATAAILNFSDVHRAQAGTYSVEITNTLGSVTSRTAQLTVIIPSSDLVVPNLDAVSGWPVTVPILLNASGEENALSFSLSFGSEQRPGTALTFTGATVGSGSVGAVLVLNTNQLTFGRVGLALALPAGATFPPGTQEVALLSFDTGVVTNAAALKTALGFRDQPVLRQVSDPLAISLSATYTWGTLTLAATDLEGDSTPRPGGNRFLTINDWVQSGRFVAGLDVAVSESEFQRADCAPRTTRGDGRLKVTDWVQAGRYFAGLDPLTAVGGPTSPSSPLVVKTGLGRELRILDVAAIQELEAAVPVQLNAQGDENAVGFTVRFDPARVQYLSFSLGADAAGALLNVNDTAAAEGSVGIVLALPAGASFSQGARELGSFYFVPKTVAGPTAVGFVDGPVLRALSDAGANELEVRYVDGAIAVNPLPTLRVGRHGNLVTLTWPIWASDFKLQASAQLGNDAAWSSKGFAPQTNGTELLIKIPLNDQSQWFRLQRP